MAEVETGQLSVERESPDSEVLPESVMMYLREVGRFPLLSAQEEQQLGR